MTRVLSLWRRGRRSTACLNVLAATVCFAALGILQLNFDPLPVGIDPAEAAIDVSRFSQAIATASNAESASASEDAIPVGDRELVQHNIQKLERAVGFLESIPDYTATFFKRELVNGSMGDGQVVHLKLRHQPFSVYMKWIVGDKGRELLYVDGENDGNMLVKVGGLKGRLLPCIKLEPTSTMALNESRHPVTNVGLLNLCKRMLKHRREELAAPKLQLKCRLVANQQVDGVACDCFIVDFETPEVCSPYRRTVQYYEKKHGIPICVMNYGWQNGAETDATEVDESSLIEHYSYADLKFNLRLADVEFDRTNENYLLRR